MINSNSTRAFFYFLGFGGLEIVVLILLLLNINDK